VYSVEEKFSTDFDKVVMHMLTKAHISHTHTLSLSERCSALRGVCSTTFSKPCENFLGCYCRCTMMLCASVEFAIHVYLLLQLFVGFLNICWLNQILKFQECQTLTCWRALFCRGKFPACEVPKFYRTPFHHRDLCTYPSKLPLRLI